MDQTKEMGQNAFRFLTDTIFSGLIFILVIWSPSVIFNASNFGKGMVVLIACVSLLIGY